MRLYALLVLVFSLFVFAATGLAQQSVNLEQVACPGQQQEASFAARGVAFIDADGPLTGALEPMFGKLPMRADFAGSFAMALSSLEADAQGNNRVKFRPIQADMRVEALGAQYSAVVDKEGLTLDMAGESKQMTPWELDPSGMLGLAYGFLFNDGLTLITSTKGELLALEVPLLGRQDLAALGIPRMPDLALPVMALMLGQKYDKQMALPLGAGPGAPLMPVGLSFLFAGMEQLGNQQVAKIHSTFTLGPLNDLTEADIQAMMQGLGQLAGGGLPSLGPLDQLQGLQQEADMRFSKLLLTVEADSWYNLATRQFVKESGTMTGIARIVASAKEAPSQYVNASLRTKIDFSYVLTDVPN